jgi:DNA-binding response OmpR family regulator
MLLDLGLPDGDGVDLLRDLRKNDPLPVIVISGRDSETDRVKGLDVGADDYVTKPFSPREVVSRVASVLRRADASPSRSMLRFGEIRIDINAHEVRKNEKPIPLTSKEFDLLVCLARQPRTVFSRLDLLNEVWASKGQECSEATVTEHVRRLRMKLEDSPSSPRYLCAVRGVGYRLVP